MVPGTDVFPANRRILSLSGSSTLHVAARCADYRRTRMTAHTSPSPVPIPIAPRRARPRSAREMAAIETAYLQTGVEESQPTARLRPTGAACCAIPTKDLHHADPEALELWAPVFGERDVHRAGIGSDHPAQRRPDRRTHGDHRPRSSTVTAGPCATSWWRSGRPTPAGRYIHKRDQHPRRSDPNFTGDGPLPHRRRRQLPLHHHQSRAPTRGRTTATRGGRRTSTSRCSERISPQRMDHPDVLSRRSAVRPGPDLPVHHRPEGTRPALVAAYDHDVTSHEWATGYRLGHRADPLAAHRISRMPPVTEDGGALMTMAGPSPGADDRPVLRLCPAVRTRRRARYARRRARRHPVPRHRHRRRGPAGTRCAAGDLAGRRRRAGCPTPRDHCIATAGPSPGGAGYPPTTKAISASAPSNPRAGDAGSRAVHRHHRVRTRAAQPAVHPRLRARSGLRGRSAAVGPARRPARHPDRHPRRAGPALRPSGCRATARRVFLRYPGQ